MGKLGFTSQTVSGGIPIFQQAYENAQGGFALDKTGLVDGQVIPAGTVMGYDEATRKAKPLKVAVLHADAANNAVEYQVKKGHIFAVGNYLAAAVGGAAYAITEINTSNADYDVLKVGTTLGVALTAADGVILFQSSATGADVAALNVAARGLLYSEVTVADNVTVSVTIRGTVYERRIPVVLPAVKSALPNIIFSQSY